MKKRQSLMFLAIVLLVAVLIVLFFLQPSSLQPVEFPLTLTMTKVDQEGNTSNNYQMYIEGTKGESSSGISYLYAAISFFDGITGIETINDSDSNLPEIQTRPNMDPCFVSCLGWNAEMPISIQLSFSADLERWLFYNTTDGTFYLGAVNDKYTTQELYEYFGPIITGSWPA